MGKVIAVVGAQTLLGREIREVLEASHLDLTVRQLNTEEDEGNSFTRAQDDLVAMEHVSLESLEGAEVVVLAAPTTVTLPKDARLIDLTASRQGQLVAPMVTGPMKAKGTVHTPHPAAIAMGLLLARLPETPVRAVFDVFEPASERGKDGIDELQQQTINLLSFKPLPQTVFDAQASFNLLSAYGENAREPLAAIEERLAEQMELMLAGRPMPSLRVLHAPVFHGLMMSAWMEFAGPVEQLAERVANELVEVRGTDVEQATNVGVAGQTGLIVSIKQDRQQPNAYWFWIGADNLRLIADNVLVILTSWFGRGRVN